MSKELLFSVTKKDLDIEFFSGSGAGGQYRNKHQNCVRMKHRDSGVIVTGQSNRERPANMREAFKNLTNNAKFKTWLNLKIQEAMIGKSIEQRVKESMIPENLKIECKINGKWTDACPGL